MKNVINQILTNPTIGGVLQNKSGLLCVGHALLDEAVLGSAGKLFVLGHDFTVCRGRGDFRVSFALFQEAGLGRAGKLFLGSLIAGVMVGVFMMGITLLDRKSVV